MKPITWLVLLLAAILAYGYAFIVDKMNGKDINPKKYLGITLALGIAVVATVLNAYQTLLWGQKYVGGPIIGLLIGMILCNVTDLDADYRQGTTFAAKKFLSFGIVLVGATLNFSGIVAATRALPLVIFNICLSFGIAFLVGRNALKVSDNVCCMVGGGTCICGGTAIAALGSIIKAAEDEIGYAMTAIFLFDVLSCISYPYLSGAIGLTPQQYAFLGGTAINDTSSVVASADTYAALNGLEGSIASAAVTVKLVRTSMLIVVAMVVALIMIRKAAKAAEASGETISVGATVKKVFPWFILVFLIMAILNTVGLFSAIPGIGAFLTDSFFGTGSKFLITAALAGVGFKMKFKDLFTKGVKPILLGGCTWLCVAASSMIFIHLFADYVNQTVF